jgi:hypothetical protein
LFLCFLAYLVFEYDPKVDTLLRVTKEDYRSCNGRKPIEKYDDGRTKVELDRSEVFYFIGGAKGFCENGQKLSVVVIPQGISQLTGLRWIGKLIAILP